MERFEGGAWECFADERILKCESFSLKKIARLEKEQTEEKEDVWTAGFKLMLVSVVFKK